MNKQLPITQAITVVDIFCKCTRPHGKVKCTRCGRMIDPTSAHRVQQMMLTLTVKRKVQQ